ncbi:Putative ribonuclease H protein At1g65750 [Linum perenne]
MDRDSRLAPAEDRRLLMDIAWELGPGDWVTVNTDGSVLSSPDRAARGGIVRSSEGQTLATFDTNLGICSVTRAELRGAILGLELAWSLNCKLVELQQDSRAAVALLSHKDDLIHQHSLEVLAF